MRRAQIWRGSGRWRCLRRVASRCVIFTLILDITIDLVITPV
jgi:hypothetical protein